MRHPYRTIGLAVGTVVLLSGCTTMGHFRLLLTVKDAETGEPLEFATGDLDTRGNEERKHEMTQSGQLPWTNENGQSTYDFQVSPYPHDRPHWYLKLRKEGFESVVIDIKPNPQPEQKRNEPMLLHVTVEMKPLPKQP